MIVFKFPFNENIFTLTEEHTEDSVKFVSFDGTGNTVFKGKIEEITAEKLLQNELFSDSCNGTVNEFSEQNQDGYEKKLKEVIAFIKRENLRKLVISRRKKVDYNEGKISLSGTFLNLCNSYPNAFVYFFQKDKTWMGAFSELLGKFDKKTGEFQTMSLAGTLPIDESWTEKEIEEQKPVSDYISAILTRYSHDVEVSETYDHHSGNIKHLRNDFRAKIKPTQLEELIAELHPTPAVCGIPKEKCRNAIRDFENYDRELYAGYIRIETGSEVQYFVNLRCAQFFRKYALLYVGGGITALSSPEKEWQETELKAQAIRKNITV